MKFVAATLLSLAFTSMALQAHPLISNGNVLPGPGYIVTLSAAGGITSAGNAGENQTWDFSSATLSEYGSVEVVSTSSTPYATQFASCNYAWKLTPKAGGISKYDFWKVSADKFEHVGFNFGGQDGDDYSNNPQTELKFPFTFQDSLSDSYSKINRTDSDFVNVIFDGYGTLKLPTASYQVFRIRRNFKSTKGSYTNVAWYNVANLFPVAEHRGGSNLLVTFTGGSSAQIKSIINWRSPKYQRWISLGSNTFPEIETLSSRGLNGRISQFPARGFRVAPIQSIH